MRPIAFLCRLISLNVLSVLASLIRGYGEDVGSSGRLRRNLKVTDADIMPPEVNSRDSITSHNISTYEGSLCFGPPKWTQRFDLHSFSPLAQTI